ncbi:hypothetical protein ACT29H_09280 [Thermophagus sp. OGC60D27]|uniref:hypothetical protein n=1 Tax=Thermophagus sp. OGC60D27 TaxID=3458415 RepID=UPI004037A658
MGNNGLDIRIQKIISEFGLNQSSFARRCGFPESQTRQFLKGTNVGITHVIKVIDGFPELNPMWILKGEEPMYKSEMESQKHTNIESQNNASKKEYCMECFIKDGRIKQLEVFNESLIKRNNELNQELGRLKALVGELKLEIEARRKATG